MTDLPYRPCAGIMLLNARSEIWVGQRIPKPHDAAATKFAWQMPQGGIDSGEEVERAAKRELYEETGAQNVEVIHKTSNWLKYDLPPELVGKALKGKYRGQKQMWFAMRFLGEDTDFDISGKITGHEPEFSDWRWAASSDLVNLAVPFKRGVYQQVLTEFADLLT